MCPGCGAGRGRVTENDETDEGLPLRERLCDVCGARYPTVEIPFTGATISQVGTRRRDQKREYGRRTRGFHDMNWGTYRRPFAYLIHSVSVVWRRPRRGKRASGSEE